MTIHAHSVADRPLARAPEALPEEEVEAFGRALDAIYRETMADLGERDERYIRRLIRVQRSLTAAGRVVIFASLGLHPAWGHAFTGRGQLWAVLVLGTAMLALGKVLENMEIAHNVMHGQWDWLRDPRIQSSTWEWDSACSSREWRHYHNVVHHRWTNVIGMDRDLGFGSLRVSDQQEWRVRFLLQPFYDALLAVLFEWGLAIHGIRLGAIKRGEVTREALRSQLGRIARKAGRQVVKDYVLWPALAGPFFLYVLAANLMANVARNLWLHTIIFCGHFPPAASVFRADEIATESRARWYVRQAAGSCNIEGGWLFHVLSGNLGHQIEHHLFSDMPSRRYAEIAPRVRALCARHGVPYHTGSLGRQFGGVALRILRLALPGPSASAPTRSATALSADQCIDG